MRAGRTVSPTLGATVDLCGGRLRPPDEEQTDDHRPGSGLRSTGPERAEEKRQEKLDHVREQVESGELTIRKMTAEERRRYPPKPEQPKRSDKR